MAVAEELQASFVVPVVNDLFHDGLGDWNRFEHIAAARLETLGD